ncbi:hypothetical protein [Kitasatospora sp. NPDC005751]|uniref:hypothetical protein n=1 Tax=Kitasatospora sp. NPDC005751 TaxID=3157064 RepID=UPI0033E3B2CD
MTAGARRAAAVGAALARLDLTAEAALLSGADLWSLPAGEAVGLGRLTARVSTPLRRCGPGTPPRAPGRPAPAGPPSRPAATWRSAR